MTKSITEFWWWILVTLFPPWIRTSTDLSPRFFLTASPRFPTLIPLSQHHKWKFWKCSILSPHCRWKTRSSFTGFRLSFGFIKVRNGYLSHFTLFENQMTASGLSWSGMQRLRRLFFASLRKLRCFDLFFEIVEGMCWLCPTFFPRFFLHFSPKWVFYFFCVQMICSEGFIWLLRSQCILNP